MPLVFRVATRGHGASLFWSFATSWITAGSGPHRTKRVSNRSAQCIYGVAKVLAVHPLGLLKLLLDPGRELDRADGVVLNQLPLALRFTCTTCAVKRLGGACCSPAALSKAILCSSQHMVKTGRSRAHAKQSPPLAAIVVIPVEL